MLSEKFSLFRVDLHFLYFVSLSLRFEGILQTFLMKVLFNNVDFDLEITFGIVLIGYSKLLFKLKSLMLLLIEKTDQLSELAFEFLAQRLILLSSSSFLVFYF